MTNIQWNRIVILSSLTEEEVEVVKPIFHTLSIPSGEEFIREGDQGSEMYILVSGKVRVTKSLIIEGMTMPLAELRDPRKVLATLDHDSYPLFGELALLDQELRSATVETLEECQFLVTDKERFYDLVDSHPGIGSTILASLGRRLAMVIRRNNQELVKLTTALALALSQR